MNCLARTSFAFLTVIFLYAFPASGGQGGILYVVHTVPNTVSIFDPELMKLMRTISVGLEPLSVAVSPDARWLAVSHRVGGEERPDIIWIIDREKEEVAGKVEIYLTRYRERGESYLLFSIDGGKLYAVEGGTGFLDVVRTSDWRLIKKVSLGIHPQNPLLSNDGKRLYVPNLYSKEILIVDTEKDVVVDSLKIDGLPSAIALSEDEKTLYIADAENHRVIFIDAASRNVIKTVSVGTFPQNIILAEGFLYVLNTYSNSISVIDIETKQNIKTLPGGILPKNMAYDPKNKRLYVVSNDASVSVIDTVGKRPLKSIATDITPSGVVFAP